MSQLRSCQACARHVYASETVCPFCRQPLAPPQQRAVPRISNGLSRAQRFAMAAALAAPLGGCVEEVVSSEGTATEEDGARSVAAHTENLVAVPLYGAPIAGAPVEPAAGKGGPIVHPLYGAPLPVAGASGAGGAGGKPGPIVHPLYGAPLTKD